MIKINKNNFIKLFPKSLKEKIANIYEKIELVKNIDYFIQLEEFYSGEIWKKLLKYEYELGVKIILDNYIKNGERKNIIIAPIDLELNYDQYFNLNMIKIENLSKFKDLGHRNYLGNILSYGIKREKISDIVINDGNAYFVTFSDIAEYLINNINSIDKNNVIIKKIYNNEKIEIQFERITGIISSNRLDNIVSLLTKLSRNEAVKLIEKNLVYVDYEVINKKNKSLNEKNILTIRGYGKYFYKGIVGSTKKDRLKVEMMKFM
ncbi:RNA-binding protein YlmH [Hypnocyclicus thermotrophus]|uniref:RNA-binding protein YlmH n=1 Tax=Hypnocyclicus thermotrophus TaxID=1627895 RepID=A0AA46I664_9FUSO|nr:YlmH/Sll1252 family protein [Hypnocyclicus thermotrophus]TDT71820.1 RNA-binding protein YlmH [Hypnocyclicus thermotrophus]